MPTKDELTNENAELRAKIAELEAGQAEPVAARVRDEDGEFAEPEEGGVYRYDGSGDFVAVSYTPGGYLYTPGSDKDDGSPGELARIAEGTWKLVQAEGGAEIGTLTDGSGSDAERIEMLTKDVTRLEIERNDARNEVVRLKRRIADAGSLHGRIDNLPGVVG